MTDSETKLGIKIRRLVDAATDETRDSADRDKDARRIPYLQARLFAGAAWYKVASQGRTGR